MLGDSKNWENAWFLSRVILGWAIHVILICFALFNIEIVFEYIRHWYVENMDSKFSPNFVAFAASISFFTASMAGAFWVKQMYIRYALPELMDELTKRLMK